MSSAYSHLNNYSNLSIYKPDYNFLQAALSYKQNKLDVNRAKLQNLADQYSMLKVHNDVDKEYLETRLEQVRDITNKYANMDLSDDNFTKSLMANVNQVLDDKVMNAVVSTKMIEAEDAVWRQMRDKGDGKYSERNHAYALANSDRKNYENAAEAGAMYKGGAGFIEYRDLSKKLMDNIGNISKQLEAEWIETGPNQGYFRSIVTKKAIDRNKMEGAIGLLFDEKDKRQININAWSTYDQVDNSTIKEDWDRQFQPEIDLAEKRIAALEALKSDKNSGISPSEIEEELSAWTKKRDSLKNNSFENTLNTYGREAAYQTLYNAKYVDTILDTYSYEPRVIDIKLDQAHAESVKFAQKIANDNRDYELQKAKFLYQIEKDKATTEPSDQTRYTTDDNVLETPKAELLKNEIQTIQAEETEAIRNMTNLFGGKKVSVEDYKNLKEQLSDMGNLIGKTVNVGGKEVRVTKDNIAIFDRFKYNVLEDSESERALKSKLEGSVKETVNKLRQVTQAYYEGRPVDMNPNELIEPTFKLIKDPKTGKVSKVPLDNPNSKNFQRLLRKNEKDLTPSEKITLEAYTTIALVGDSDIKMSPEVKRLMFKNFKTDFIIKNNVTEKDFDNFFGSKYEDVEFNKSSWRGYNEAFVGTNGKNKPSLIKPVGIGGDAYLSELTSRDMEYNKRSGAEVSLGGINDLISNTVESLQFDIKELGKQLNLASQKNLMVTKDDPSYNRLKSELVRDGKIDDNFKGNIEINYKIGSGGQYTGDATLSVTQKNTGDDKKEQPYTKVYTSVKSDYLDELGIKVEQMNRPAYSAMYGKNSKPITLGPGNAADNDDDIVIQNKDLLRDQANKVGARPVVDRMISNYYNGDYRFELLPMNGVYYYAVKDESGNIVTKVQTEDQEYDSSDIANIYSQAGNIASNLMYEAIQKKIKEFDIKAK